MTIQEKLKFPWAAIDARSVSGPRRVRGWEGGGFSPPLFCKTKINETKNNLTKITEPKKAPPPSPHSKICCAVPGDDHYNSIMLRL